MIKRLKVIWICHFTNANIQNKLKVRKNIPEFAPWISLGIEEVKRRNDIELHIVSPHRWISKNTEFVEDKIHYHFFNPGIPFYGRHWPVFFPWDAITNFYFNRKQIKKYVEQINPDIIHWHGSENAYFTSSFFDLHKKYPYLVTIQGFISAQVYEASTISKKLSYELKKRIKIEKHILSIAKNFGIRDLEMKERILKYNLNSEFYWHEYFVNIHERPDNIVLNESKLYDIIFFTRIIKSKGIEDLIKAVGLLKSTIPNIKVAILGSSNPEYIIFLKQLASINNCLENLDFIGFVPKQEDIYKILRKSKVFVLPAYMGDVPSCMVESMVRKVPVISYKFGGVPDINNERTNIELVDIGNIEELAARILFLLDNPLYAEELAERAYEYVIMRWNNAKALDDIINAYKLILHKSNV